jgi:hypothetical protein
MPGQPTRWARLEPAARDRELSPGLEARVHDPLWLLGRQWQFGEFTADDAGSAITAQVTASVAPMTKLRLGKPGPGARTGNYSVPAVPLETLVEADDVRAAPTARMRVRAGQHFERLLAASGLAEHVAAFRAAYPVASPPAAADAASRRFLALVTGRALDGDKLHKALKSSLRATPPALPATPAIAPEDAAAVLAVARTWVTWADELVFAPSGGPAGWLPDRLEYAFGMSSPDGVGLEATEYTDGRLDWHSFTTAGSAGNPPAGRTAVGPLTMVPTPVSYPGMPASRLWEFEDGRVNFGAVDARPEDLGRMLLSGFALVYGADWMLLPLEVPVGALVRVTRLDVRDTFGRVTTVGPTGGGWSMFGMTGANDALLVAPALASGLQGRDIEDVLLLRDEVANLAWAVERAVEGEHGLPADQAQAAAEEAEEPSPPSGLADPLPYRLRTDPPRHWFPLLPQRERPADPSMTFRLGALARDGRPPLRPRGGLLAPLRTVPLREDEVPREGAHVTRAYQLARWIDGTTFLWLGRRKGVGRGEGSSGLRFDSTE